MEQGSPITFFGALHTKGLREFFIIIRSLKPTPVRGLPQVNRTCKDFVFVCSLRWFVKVLGGALNTDFLEALDVLDVLEVLRDILNVLPDLALILKAFTATASWGAPRVILVLLLLPGAIHITEWGAQMTQCIVLRGSYSFCCFSLGRSTSQNGAHE